VIVLVGAVTHWIAVALEVGCGAVDGPTTTPVLTLTLTLAESFNKPVLQLTDVFAATHGLARPQPPHLLPALPINDSLWASSRLALRSEQRGAGFYKAAAE
jgi:hypothetical protein